jgi:mannose-6-phosphate isomerase-like protein (cupin superfamily)
MSYPPDRYLKDEGESSAVLRRATQPPELNIGEITQTSYLATGATTGGRFGLYRWDMGPQPAGPSAHFHKSISESFFVLSGTVRVYDGASWADAMSGDFLYVPEGGIHAFRNESGAPASMLLLFVPGAPREPYFETLAEVASSERAMTREELLDLWLHHDTYPA